MSTRLPIDSWRRDRKAVPAIALWLTLSILLHLALLLWTPRPRVQPGAEPAMPPLTVVLRTPPPLEAPAAEPPPAPPPAAAPPPPKARAPRQAKQPTPKPPPVIARAKPEQPPAAAPAPKVEEPPAPAPQAAPPPPVAQAAPPAPPAPPAVAPAEPDLAAYVEARRRARGEVPDASATDADRANRGILNSALLKQPVPSALTPQKPRNGYGSFEIRRRGVDYAEYAFKGWNENFRRDGLELIEVRLGNHGSIDLAVVRSIIGIIRRTENGDFTWVSRRLGRSLTLSARARDNAGLEEFMMQEFYDDLHRYR